LSMIEDRSVLRSLAAAAAALVERVLPDIAELISSMTE
jgi:hypothetical protein